MDQGLGAAAFETARPDSEQPTGEGATRARVDPALTWYPESRFGGYTDIDQVVTFYTRVRALLDPTSTVLDVGCGRGKQSDDPVAVRRELKTLAGAAQRLIGLDVDPDAKRNPFLDEFHQIRDGEGWPIPDGTIDLALADYVLEHVEDTPLFFRELARVVRPGGHVCIRTTNKLSYFALAARLVPNRAHSHVIQRVYTRPRGQEDVFPTRYQCNTLRAVRKALDGVGFDHAVYGYNSEPAHFGFSRPLYALGVLHQRYAPSYIRPAIFAFGRRRTDDS